MKDYDKLSSGSSLSFDSIPFDSGSKPVGTPLPFTSSDVPRDLFHLLDDYGLTGTFRERGQNAINTFTSLTSGVHKGNFESVYHFFGGRSPYDRLYGELHSNLLHELEELRNLQEEQEYNSPLSQVGRNTVAGINSDLAGNVDPGEASENSELPEPGSAFRNAESGLGDITNVVTGALSMYSTLASIEATKAGTGLTQAQTRGVDISNMSSNIDFTDKENSFFKKVFNHVHTAKQVDDLLKGNSLELDVPSDTALISAGLRTAKQRERYRAFQEAYVDSFNFAIEGFQNQADYLGAESDVARKRSDSSRPEGNPFDSSFVQLPSGKVISRRSNLHEGYISGLRTLANYERDILKLNYQFNKEYLSTVSGTWRGKKENAQNKFDYEFFDKSDGGLKAQLEAAQNRFNERVFKTKLNIIDRLINSNDPFTQSLALQWIDELSNDKLKMGYNYFTGELIKNFDSARSAFGAIKNRYFGAK